MYNYNIWEKKKLHFHTTRNSKVLFFNVRRVCGFERVTKVHARRYIITLFQLFNPAQVQVCEAISHETRSERTRQTPPDIYFGM